VLGQNARHSADPHMACCLHGALFWSFHKLQ